MIINLIRHCDPDYNLDRLTINGRHQANLLAQSLSGECTGDIYSSPQGRALETAQALTEITKFPITVLDFLREMDDVTVWDVKNPKLAVWNISPSTLLDLKYSLTVREGGVEHEFFKASNLLVRLEEIYSGMSSLLNEYGVEFCDGKFRLIDEFRMADNIYVFGHYGCHMAIIAFLCNIDILDVWRTVFLDTSSVTKLLLENIGDGQINFRILALGETSHLYMNEVAPSRNGLQYNLR